jgi:SAM-dependent methyltransferase
LSDRSASGTWHHGLVARWWAEINEPTAREVDYLRQAIAAYGQPALDLGVGTGRILLPLLAAGLDVDGADVSADMLSYAEEAADKAGFRPRLRAQPMHELEMGRTYRTVYIVGSFGLGGDWAADRETLRRIWRHLAPTGALLINHELPYARDWQWKMWPPGGRAELPRPWPESGDRRTLADGDELELIARTLNLDPLAQRLSYEMRARLWHAGVVAREEHWELHENLYFAQEIVPMLEAAGFVDARVEGGYSGEPATADDGEVMFVARKPEA